MSQSQEQAFAQVGSQGDNNKKKQAVKVFKAHAAMFFRDPRDGNFDADFLAGEKFGSAVDVPITLGAQPRASDSDCFQSFAFILHFPFAASAVTERQGHGVSYLCKS